MYEVKSSPTRLGLRTLDLIFNSGYYTHHLLRATRALNLHYSISGNAILALTSHKVTPYPKIKCTSTNRCSFLQLKYSTSRGTSTGETSNDLYHISATEY